MPRDRVASRPLAATGPNAFVNPEGVLGPGTARPWKGAGYEVEGPSGPIEPPRPGLQSIFSIFRGK